MTPGVPLTPGMPGFTMGSIPPPTPPAFVQPFMSPGLAMMSPGIPGYQSHIGFRMIPSTPGAGPPTPWQVGGMSAAPGVPGGPPPGQMTPRGGINDGGAAYNPFFANAIGYQAGTMPQTPHWNVNPRPPQQQRGRRSREPSEAPAQAVRATTPTASAADAIERSSSTAGEAPTSSGLDESALSSRSASPAVAPLSSSGAEGYPFPAVDQGKNNNDAAAHSASSNIAVELNPPSSSAAQPPQHAGAPAAAAANGLHPSAFSLLTRRASTNSPAVSPGIFGHFGSVAGGGAGESNTSFGYFGAALSSLVGAQQQQDGHGRDRRPSLGADDLRTPAREVTGGGGGGYFPAVTSDAGAASDVSARATADGQGSHSAGAEGAPFKGASKDLAPRIPLAQTQKSTEEMAKAIAKMSIQGTAMKRTGSQRSHQQGGGVTEGGGSNGNTAADVHAEN